MSCLLNAVKQISKHHRRKKREDPDCCLIEQTEHFSDFKFHRNIQTLFSKRFREQRHESVLCAYLARGGMLRLNVYTASFSHSSLFHLPHLLPGSPREKPCHSGNTLAKDAIRDTAALRATFVSFLIEGWQKQAFVCKSSERLEPETD